MNETHNSHRNKLNYSVQSLILIVYNFQEIIRYNFVNNSDHYKINCIHQKQLLE